MPMRYEPFCSHPCISPPHALLISLWRRRRCSALRPNTRLFPVCRVDDAPQHLWAPPPPPRLHPFPPPPAPRHLLHIARASAAASKRQRACTQGAASAAEQDSSQESVFSASQLFHLLSPRSATSPQASDLGSNSDGTAIAEGSNNDGSSATTRASVLTRGQQQRTADLAAQDAFLGGMIYTLSCRLLSGTQYTSVAIR